MNRSTKRRGNRGKTEGVDRLLEEARKRPGVSELLEAYQSWQRIETAIQPHRFLMGQQITLSASNSSEFE